LAPRSGAAGLAVKPFAFRAEVALTLRKRQEEQACRELAAAAARARTAAELLERAREAMAGAMREAGECDGRGGDPTLRVWYRNWITGQRQLVERSAQVVEARRGEVAAATERAVLARRKRKALERLRQKALMAWNVTARREEQKAIDELATVRFARAERGGRACP